MSDLESERLIYSRPAKDDLSVLLPLWRKEAFVKHILPKPATEEEVWVRLLRDIGHWQVAGYGNWRMWLKSDRSYVGSVGIFDMHRDIEPPMDDLETGWGIDPAYQGQGYALEAVSALLHFADQELKAARTVCIVNTDNLASLKLAGKVGYLPYGESPYHDHNVVRMERFRPG